MDGKGFQVLVAQLGDLSGVQRAALITALKRRLPVDEALQLIDTHFRADPCCGHCRSKNAGGWSAQGGLKRYRCKDCGKTFNALTGTPSRNCIAAMPGSPTLRPWPTASVSGGRPSAAHLLSRRSLRASSSDSQI